MTTLGTWPPSGAAVEQARQLLEQRHLHLHDHLVALREARRGVDERVFLVEHGLNRDELAELEDCVRVALHGCGLADRFWTRRFLPLGVAATEVGYAFRGGGTPYWPLLKKRLRYPFEPEDRAALADLFKTRIHRITGVEPPQTRRAGFFHLIAWPITHALSPLELHGPLLQALLHHPRAITAQSSTEEVLEPLRQWAARADHQQLAVFLELGEIAAAVVRHFLAVPGDRLSLDESFLSRVTRDLKDQGATLRDLKEARRRQRYLRAAEPTAPLPPPKQIWAPLLLEPPGQDQAPPSLWIVPPRVAPELSRTHLAALGSRARTRLLGGRRAGVAELVGGQPVELRSRALPPAEDDGGAPLVDDLPDGLPVQLALHLRAARVDVRRPLLFAEHVGPAHGAGQVRRHACYAGPTWWVATAQSINRLLPPGVSRQGEVAGLELYRVEPATPADFAWLADHGIQQEHRALLRLVGSPSLEGPAAEVPTYLCGDDVVLIVDGSKVQRPQGSAWLEPGAYRVGLGAAPGLRLLKLAVPGGEVQSVELRVAEAPSPAEPVHLSLTAGDLSTGLLARGEVGLRLAGEQPFAGLRVRLSLEREGKVLATSVAGPLPALPCILPPDDGCWAALREAALAAPMAPLALRAEVGAVAQRQWWLEPPAWSARWTAAADDSEVEPDDLYVFDAAQPLRALESSAAPRGRVTLRQPWNRERDLPEPGTGRVTAPGGLSVLRLPAMPAPHLLRQLDAPVSDVTWAAWPLVARWVAWSTATGHGLLAEGARRQVSRQVEGWLVSLLCGHRWVEPERASGLAPRFGVLLAHELREAGLGRDEPADEALSMGGICPTDDQLEGAWQVLLEDHRDHLLDAELEDDDDPGVELVSSLLNLAYERVAGKAGRAAAPDLWVSAEDLGPMARRAAGTWHQRTELSALLPLLRPRGLAHALARQRYDGLAAGDLASVLAERLAESRAAPVRWTEEGVASLLDLWSRPAHFPLDDTGRAVIGAALVDRAAVRAVRYAWLRWDAVTQRGGV